MKPFISIIIPVFNTGKYVSETLTTILQQSFKNYEILLIDDGSEDNSAVICRRYAEIFPCITFISKKNEGVAITRNKALDIAKGEYIVFIDSDDIIYPDSLENIVSILNNVKPDFLRYDFNTIDERGNNLYPNHLRKKRKKYCDRVLQPVAFMQKVIRNEYFLCMHVFRNSIIGKYSIRFLDGCTYNEDTLFIIQYLQHCRKCIYSDTLFYGYRKYAGAVTNSFTEKNYTDVKRVYWQLRQLAEDCDSQIKRNIQKAAEQIALHLHEYASSNNHIDSEYQNIENLCKQEALLLEWKLKRFLSEHLCNIVWQLTDLVRKIINRL